MPSQTTQTRNGQTLRTIGGIARRWGVSLTTAKRRMKGDYVDSRGWPWWFDSTIDKHDRRELRASKGREVMPGPAPRPLRRG
jgi:hypothetical protein